MGFVVFTSPPPVDGFLGARRVGGRDVRESEMGGLRDLFAER